MKGDEKKNALYYLMRGIRDPSLLVVNNHKTVPKATLYITSNIFLTHVNKSRQNFNITCPF